MTSFVTFIPLQVAGGHRDARFVHQVDHLLPMPQRLHHHDRGALGGARNTL